MRLSIEKEKCCPQGFPRLSEEVWILDIHAVRGVTKGAWMSVKIWKRQTKKGKERRWDYASWGYYKSEIELQCWVTTVGPRILGVGLQAFRKYLHPRMLRLSEIQNLRLPMLG